MRQFWIICFVLIGLQSQAQQSWSLQQCIDYAMKNNLQVRIAFLNNELNKINLQQSKANALPNLNIGGSNSYNFGKTIDRYTNQFANTRVQSINLGLQSQWNLFHGLQNYHTIKQNEMNFLSGKYDAEKAKNDVSLNIVNAFLQIVMSQELISIAQNQINTSQALLHQTKKMVEAGSLPKFNQYDVESQLANEELNLVNVQNQHQIARVNLALLLNVEPNNFSVSVPPLPNLDSLPPNYDVGKIYQEALNNQPVILAAEYRVKSAERGLKIAKSNISPSINFSGSLGTGYSGLAQQIDHYDSIVRSVGYTALGDKVYSLFVNPVYAKTPYAKQFSDNLNRSLGINISIPLFNGLQTHAGISRAKISLETSRLQLVQTKLDLQNIIVQAYNDATGSLKKYKATEKSVKSLQESFKYAEQRYKVGATNSVDYTTQKNNLTNAQAQLLQAKYEYIFKVKILDFYMGKPLVL